jgi:hypothetical protein
MIDYKTCDRVGIFNLPVTRTLTWQFIGFIGMYVLRVYFGVDHLINVSLFAVFLIVVSALILWQDTELARYLKASLFRPAAVVFVVLQILIAWSYFSVTPNTEVLAQYPNVHFAYLSPSYIVSKNPDILFQQLAFALYFFDMKNRGYSLRTTQLTSAAFLFFAHFFTLLSMPVFICVIFITCSGIAGFLFPYLTLRHGLLASMSLHWLYYFSLGIAFCWYTGAF